MERKEIIRFTKNEYRVHNARYSFFCSKPVAQGKSMLSCQKRSFLFSSQFSSTVHSKVEFVYFELECAYFEVE